MQLTNYSIYINIDYISITKYNVSEYCFYMDC